MITESTDESFNYSSGSRFEQISSKSHRTDQRQSNKQKKGLRSSAAKYSGTSKAFYSSFFSTYVPEKVFSVVSKDGGSIKPPYNKAKDFVYDAFADTTDGFYH